MTRCTSPSRSQTRYLPRRPSRSTRRPLTARSTSATGSGAHHRASSTRSSPTTRPSTRGASWRRIVSTSGSSGKGGSRQVAGAGGQPAVDGGADVGQRPVVAPARRADREQRRVLARVVGVRRGRVDAVVGGQDQQV